MNKQVGIIGLGKMGGNIARRLTKKGWMVYGYNRTKAVTKNLEQEGIKGVYSLEEFINLPKPRIMITVLTAGVPTDEVLEKLLTLLEPEDIVLEFSNSLYLDTVRRGRMFEKKKIKFIDVGISGGPGGALNGACLMVGGDRNTFEQVKPLLVSEARSDALMHFEGVGAGHFIKMVHNGIEYGMMQSIAEGFNLLKNGPYKNLKMTDITSIYMNGSVVESRLVGWLADAFRKFGDNLTDLSGSVGYTGEGEWTAKIAKKFKLPNKVISDSVQFRIDSQKKPSYTGKILTGMRNAFGGHSIEKGKMT
jgi:6-phosphogluconate dehydrogenase